MKVERLEEIERRARAAASVNVCRDANADGRVVAFSAVTVLELCEALRSLPELRGLLERIVDYGHGVRESGCWHCAALNLLARVDRREIDSVTDSSEDDE